MRRGNRGTRPGMRGAGPRGKEPGDQEQWIFPRVTLTDAEKREIIAEVVAIATKAMFQQHFYKFGGKVFHQTQGGPIGLRGTCAVARVVLQLFDIKWKHRLAGLGITTWQVMRYVDDSRAILPPIRAGWRLNNGKLQFCKEWEQIDKEVSREVRTKEILKETMGGIEDYLEFTVESGEEFCEGWLPTLDTTLKVGESNTIMYKYYEKETTAKTTVHQKSAMEENIKVQILANDVVRRLSNTQEELGSRQGARTITEYGKKLLNSGYQLDQVRSILVKGIKGYKSKKLRCKKEGRNFRSTGKESNLKRSKKKLLSKAN